MTGGMFLVWLIFIGAVLGSLPVALLLFTAIILMYICKQRTIAYIFSLLLLYGLTIDFISTLIIR